MNPKPLRARRRSTRQAHKSVKRARLPHWRSRRLMCEPLEERRLLAVSPLPTEDESPLSSDLGDSSQVVEILSQATALPGDAIGASLQATVTPDQIPGPGDATSAWVRDLVTAGELIPMVDGSYYIVNPRPVVDMSLSRNAADTTNADQLWPGGGLGLDLTGRGVTVGVWDPRLVRASHREFTFPSGSSRVTVVDAGSVSDHATQVAGIIGSWGRDDQARGMAPGVTIRSRNSSDDFLEIPADAPILDLSNHSYGAPRGWDGRITWQDLVGSNHPVDTWVADYDLYTPWNEEDPYFGKYEAYEGTVNPIDSALVTAIGLTRIISLGEMDEVLYTNRNLLAVWAAGNNRGEDFGNRIAEPPPAGDQQYVTYRSTGSVPQPPRLQGPTAGGPGWYLVPADDPRFFRPPSDGNGGTGYDTLMQQATAKNTLVVGAVDDVLDDDCAPESVVIWSGSSRGPTDDGRIKPDVVANGVGVYAPSSSSDSSYVSDPNLSTGTSLAAPNVTGTAALLVEHYQNLFGKRPRSATTKGLLIHTATDVNVRDVNPDPDVEEWEVIPGPDYVYGWGLVNAAAAAQFFFDPKASFSERTYFGTEWTQEFTSDGTTPIKATIVWTDPPPPLARTVEPDPDHPRVDDRTPMLVNDLDLWITGPGGTYHYPWILDPEYPDLPAVRGITNSPYRILGNHRDNVEQVFIDPPVAGTYTIHVGHWGAEFTQDYSLFVSGATPARSSLTDVRQRLAPYLAEDLVEGVTVLVHGFAPIAGQGDELIPLALAIRNRADGSDSSSADPATGDSFDAWLLDYDLPDDGAQGAFDAYNSILEGVPREVVLLFDWAAESNEMSAGWAETAGDALFAMLTGLGLIDAEAGADNPWHINPSMHFIGVGTGAVVTSEAVERLAYFGVDVQHLTYLDPHDFDEDAQQFPVDGAQQLDTMGQPTGYGATVWGNVFFADTYYQTESFPEGRPIPGTYNVLMNDVNGIAPAFSHAALVDRYLLSVRDPLAQWGYYFSRFGGGAWPDPQFASSLPDARQDHEHTPRDVDPEDDSLYRFFRASPRWSRFWVDNGLFIFGRSNFDWSWNGQQEAQTHGVVPGWSNHGGGGTGRVESDGSDSFLVLDASGPSRTHNWVYVPEDAAGLEFIWQRTDSSADGDRLRVFGGDRMIGEFGLNAVDSDWRYGEVVAIPSELRGQTQTLTFEIVGGGTRVDSAVRITSVMFVPGVLTGDVLAVDLHREHPAATSFQIDRIELLDPQYLGDPIRVTVDSDNDRGDWRLVHNDKTVGYLLFSHRFDPEGRRFATTGQFYFVPGTEEEIAYDELTEPWAPGFQGIVSLDLTVTERVSGRSVRSPVTLALRVLPGYSTAGSLAVTDSSSFQNVIALQQRLNYLCPADDDDPALEVDGIIGPLTEWAIRKLKAARATPPTAADAQTPDLDSNALRWLNSLSANDISEVDRRAVADGLRQAGTQVVQLATAGLVGQPLPLVGATSGSSTAGFASALGAGGQDPGASGVGTTDTSPAAGLTGAQVSIASVLGLDEALLAGLFEPVAEYFETAETISAESYLAFLEARGLTGIAHINDPEYPNEYRFDLTYETRAMETRSLNLGRAAASGGIQLQGDVNVALDAGATFAISFGLNLTPGLTPTEAFFVDIRQLELSANASAVGINTPLQVGFVEASVQGGSLNLSAALLLDTVNDPTDGNLTLEDLLTHPLSTLIELTPSGSATANLPLHVQIGIGGFDSRTLFGDAAVTIGTSDIFGGELAVSFNPPATDMGLPALAKLAAPDVVGVIGQVGTFLDGVREPLTSHLRSQGLSVTLPFTGELTFADALRFKEAWEARITSLLQPTETGEITATIDDLVSRLGDALTAVNFTPPPTPGVPGVLTFEIDLSHALAERAVDFDLGESLGGLVNLSSSGSLGLQAELGARFTIGIELAPVGGDFALNDLLDLSELNAGQGVAVKVGITSERTPAALNLASSLSFELQVETAAGPTRRTVTLAPADTAGNATLADLAADVTRALQTAFAGTDVQNLVRAQVAGNRLQLVAAPPQIDPQGDVATQVHDKQILAMRLVQLVDPVAARGFDDGQIDDLADLRITLSDGTAFDIQIDGLGTVGDFLEAVRDAAAAADDDDDPQASSKFSIAAEGDHFLLTDTSRGTATAFAVRALNGSMAGIAGRGLGILASDETPDANDRRQIVGTPLHGDALGNHVFLVDDGPEQPFLEGHVALTGERHRGHDLGNVAEL